MQLLQTPEHRFSKLSGYSFAPHYVGIPFEGQTIQMHYLDEGDRHAQVVVLLHGQPSWSYLYRKMIPLLVAAGYRVIAPDLIGFGKSDKPSEVADFTYDRQEQWLRTALFDGLGLRNITLFAQDWGGLLGLRIVAFHPAYFARVMVANTGLPVGGPDSNFTPGDHPRLLLVTVGTKLWQLFSRRSPVFPIGGMAGKLVRYVKLTDAEKAAYDAPFPSRRHMAGPRAMPTLIPTDPNSADTLRNREAWRRLADFTKPFRTAFSDQDDATRILPVDEHFQAHVPGARRQRHTRIAQAGHFLQEDQPQTVAQVLIDFITENPLPSRPTHAT